jgi:hypothetical protein
MLARQVLYHLSHRPRPFCFSYFSNRAHIYDLAGLDPNPLIYTSHIAGMTSTITTLSFLLVEMGCHELFAWTVLKPQSSQCLPPQ